ncbi:unnamed protein product [Linum tenue]|uniref:Isopenicillin N synthase-like Fe(2+) 2OG dioxygenase domain-containing protein n=1 Tax=Linum tenue TaxID=586396 RepID=A0AAV0LMP8_9ROSI|nr:unnamed protein product [Linum tenue]
MALAQTIISPPLLLTSDLLPIPSNPPAPAVTSQPDYDRAADVKAFEDTKAGVKGLVDAGLTTIPRFFIHPPENDAVVAGQLITNDKFKSVEHRVVAQSSTTRSSVACFFGPGSENKYRLYGPAKELVLLGGDHVEPVYREVHLVEFLDYFKSNGSPLSHFKLS